MASQGDTFQPHKNAHHFISALIVAVVAFGLGVFFATTFLPKDDLICPALEQKAPVTIEDSEKITFEEDSQADLSPDEVKDAEETFLSTDERPVYRVGGVIKSINGSDVVIEFNVTALGIFEQDVDSRTITITSETIIEKREPKPENQFEEEFQVYRKAMQDYMELVLQNPELAADVELIEKPVGYMMTSGNISDLKVGDNIRVTTDVNIRENDSFEATFIERRSQTLEPSGEFEDEDLEVGTPVSPEEILEQPTPEDEEVDGDADARLPVEILDESDGEI